MACHTKVAPIKTQSDDMVINSHILTRKMEELREEVAEKIDKELNDSKNTRNYISMKYEELCDKIKLLTELDATVTCFRNDVRAIENQLTDLSTRITELESKVTCPKESASFFI